MYFLETSKNDMEILFPWELRYRTRTHVSSCSNKQDMVEIQEEKALL